MHYNPDIPNFNSSESRHMAIDIECSGCGARTRVSDDLAGKRVRCKSCREEFRVPRVQADDDSGDKPRTRRRTRKPRSALQGLVFVGAIVVGCILFAVGAVFVIGKIIGDREAAFIDNAAANQPRAAPGAKSKVQRIGLSRPGQNGAKGGAPE